jgi:DNA polymerase-3 subunit epsilon/exodeoxyribonuclease X
LLFLDLETTGINSDDKLCSCGLLFSEERFYELYNENKKITPKASSVHHITNEMIASKGIFSEGKIFSFLEKYNSIENILVVHNAPFICSMLASSGFVFQGKIIDTKKVAKHLIPECESYALQYLRYECKLYKEEDYTLTCNALDDAYIVKLLYNYLLELVDREEMLLLSFKPVLLEKFPFGKYKDSYIEEVSINDKNYIAWMLNLDDLDEDLRYSLEYYI